MQRGRAWVQGCCVSPTLDDFSALELGSMDRITQAPLSSVFQLALVNGWQLQEMKRKEERETCIFTPPNSCWLCHGLGVSTTLLLCFCWVIPLPWCHIHLSSIILSSPCVLRPKGNSTLPTGSLNLILNTSTHLYIESSLVSECVV